MVKKNDTRTIITQTQEARSRFDTKESDSNRFSMPAIRIMTASNLEKLGFLLED